METPVDPLHPIPDRRRTTPEPSGLTTEMMPAIDIAQHRQRPELIESVSPSGRRVLFDLALRASKQAYGPQGQVAMVLIEVALGAGKDHLSEQILPPVTSKLARVLNRRLRTIDLMVRTAETELAVLLSQADLLIAASFTERMKQPLEQALHEMQLDADIVLCMGLAANPARGPWRPDTLIELSDFRMRAARKRAAALPAREWALEADGDSLPEDWTDTEGWWPTTMDGSVFTRY